MKGISLEKLKFDDTSIDANKTASEATEFKARSVIESINKEKADQERKTQSSPILRKHLEISKDE